MNAGDFLMQLSSEKDKARVYKLIGRCGRPDANGVPRVCFIGVTNPQKKNENGIRQTRHRHRGIVGNGP